MGNRLTKTNEQAPADNETTNYTYDDENRLTKVVITKNSKQKELTFTYDPFGRRITKTLTKDEIGTDCTAPNTCPRTTNYVYDNQSIIAEYNTNGEVQTRYTHGPNIDEPLAIEIKAATTYTPYFYHADGLGSIMSISNASGTIVQRYAYDSFGNMTITTNGNISQPYTYTSREYDQETGMYFYRARYYDPKVGRFVTKDPIGFAGGINQYLYTENNPINLTDPSGNIAQLIAIPARYCIANPGACGAAILATWELIRNPPKPISLPRTDAPDKCKDKNDDCDKEWEDAYELCRRELNKPNPNKGITGGYRNIQDCARGHVSQRCGGNPIEWYP